MKRIIFVGDSCTYGSGLYESEMIDSVLLKQIRTAGPHCEWEAGNFAVPGLNFFSYVRMLQSIVPIFSPDYVVIGVQGGSELTPDYWDQLDGYGSFLWELASRFSYTGKAAMLELEYGRRMLQSGLPAGVSGRLAGSLQRLLILQREQGFRIVFLRYEKNHSGFLRDLEGQNGVSFVDAPVNWTRDPALIVPNDGHPSAKANFLFSNLIINEILKDNAGCVLEEEGG